MKASTLTIWPPPWIIHSFFRYLLWMACEGFEPVSFIDGGSCCSQPYGLLQTKFWGFNGPPRLSICIKGKKLDCFEHKHVFCFKLQCASIVVLLFSIGASIEIFSRRRKRLVSAQLSNKFGYCPLNTVSIVLWLWVHKHKSLALGQIWAFISCKLPRSPDEAYLLSHRFFRQFYATPNESNSFILELEYHFLEKWVQKPCRIAKKWFYASLWYYIIVESELFAWLASPKIENWTCLELCRIVLSCLGSPTLKKSKAYNLLALNLRLMFCLSLGLLFFECLFCRCCKKSIILCPIFCLPLEWLKS